MINAKFRNIRVVDPATGTDKICDYAVENGVYASDAASKNLPEVDAAGLFLFPGLRDIHVHFRDPGTPDAETTQTGSAAAAAGGFTCVTTMPNTTPAGDNAGWISTQIENKTIPVRIAPSVCITKGRLGREIAPLEKLASSGAAAFTDDGSFVDNADIMREALKRSVETNRAVMQHAVVPSIIKNGVIRECDISRKFGLPVMPPEAEVEAVRRDIALARETGGHLHIQHISCAGTVELIANAQREGLNVTGEASPHHVLLCCEEIPGNDANWKMAPPLGTSYDREKIRNGILNGTLSCFATDHAPHAACKKSGGFLDSANGIIGLETAAAVTWHVFIEKLGMPPLEWAKRWCEGPAGIIREKPRSLLSVGEKADFVIIDPEAKLQVTPEIIKSKSLNTPFMGMTFNAWPVLTVYDGNITFARSEWSKKGL